MCFSAGASFTAAAGLGIIGAATVTHVKNKRDLAFAAIPLIFAAQQAIEGLLWLDLTGTQHFTLILTAAFVFFAFCWWPAYAPFAVWLVERNRHAKKIIGCLMVAGIALGAFQYAAFLLHPLPAIVANRCIYYQINEPYGTFLAALYLAVTVGAGFISTRKILRLFSALIGAFAVVAWLVYTQNFASVWCFFAAIVSLVLYFHRFEKN